MRYIAEHVSSPKCFVLAFSLYAARTLSPANVMECAAPRVRGNSGARDLEGKSKSLMQPLLAGDCMPVLAYNLVLSTPLQSGAYFRSQCNMGGSMSMPASEPNTEPRHALPARIDSSSQPPHPCSPVSRSAGRHSCPPPPGTTRLDRQACPSRSRCSPA